jgi:Ca2+-binding RTX toxin-like protein
MAQTIFTGTLGNGWYDSETIDNHDGTFTTITNWDNGDFPSTIDNAIIQNVNSSIGTGVVLSGSDDVGGLQIGSLSDLTIEGNGLLTIEFNLLLDNDSTNGGTLTLSDGGIALGVSFSDPVQDLVNANMISVNNSSSIAFHAGETDLSGGGVIAMGGGNLTGGSSSTTNILHNVDNSIQGTGTIGDGTFGSTFGTFGFTLAIDNQADGVINGTGNFLQLSGETTNAGTLEATVGGILDIESNVTQTGDGVIEAIGTGSQVWLAQSTVKGGLITTSGGGTIHAKGTVTLDSTTDAGQVHNAGAFVVDDGVITTLNGTINNTGSISLAGTGLNAVLKVATGGATLTGGGTVLLTPTTDDNAAFFTGQSGGTASVLHNVNNKIAGSGHIGDSISLDGNLDLDNQAAGLISANTARSLTLEGMSIENAGKIQSTSTGGLVTQDLVLRQTGAGIIQAAGAGALVTIKDTSVFGGAAKSSGANASVMLENSVLEGVTLSTSLGGKFYVVQDGDLFPGDPGWVTVFDGSSDSGAIHNNGIVEVTDHAILELDGSIVNAGTLNVHSMSQEATMHVGSGGATLTGSGKLLLSTDSHFSTEPVVTGFSTSTRTTLHNASTISGAGTLGDGDENLLLAIDNQASGIISGNNADAALVIDTGANVVNRGLLVANGGSLTVNDAVTGAGHAQIVHGGQLRFDGSFNQDVAFVGANAGNLQLNLLVQSQYTGDISGFAQGDTVTLHGKSFFALADSKPFVWKENAQNTGGTLSISLQTQPGTPVVLHMNGYYTTGAFNMTADISNTLVVNVADTFYEGTSGVDHLTGQNGKNDTFAGLAGKDVIDGGTGSDTVLYGDKTAVISVDLDGTHPVTVKAGGVVEDTIKNIENVVGGSGNDRLTGDGNANRLDGGDGDDTIIGGSGPDTLLGGAGNDTVRDTEGLIVAGDKINGGAGTDKIVFNGQYTGAAALTMNATTVAAVETLVFTNGFNYDITTASATVASGKTLTVDASGLDATHKLIFDGSAETNGHFVIQGGKGGDHLTGGAKADTFVYSGALQSTSTTYDTITGFKFGTDKFDVAGSITKIDAKVTTKVTAAHFDTDLTGAVAGHLGAHHAMLVTANASSGGLSGDVFLVVDLNGKAGYQTGHDLVVHLDGAHGTLAASDFV